MNFPKGRSWERFPDVQLAHVALFFEFGKSLGRSIATRPYRPNLLTAAQELFEIPATTDRIPNRINLQTRERRRLPGRNRKQISKPFYCLLRFAGPRLNLSETILKKCSGKGILLHRHQVGGLTSQPQRIRILT